MKLGGCGWEKGWGFWKNANDLSDILCIYTMRDPTRKGVSPVPGGVLPLFPFCSRSVPAFTCRSCSAQYIAYLQLTQIMR